VFKNDGPSKSDRAGHSDRVTRDQIEYIADLVHELKEMARRYELITLEGILEVAHKDARLRTRDFD